MMAELSEHPIFLEYVDVITETLSLSFIHLFIHTIHLYVIVFTLLTNLQVYRNGRSCMFVFKGRHEIRKWARPYSNLLSRKCSDTANITNPTIHCQVRYNRGRHNSVGSFCQAPECVLPHKPQQESGLWQEWTEHYSACESVFPFLIFSSWKTTFGFLLLLLLLLSLFSRVRLCETPQTAAHQALPSLGFSRQEHWSGLPFPSPMHEREKWKWSCSVVSDSSWPHGLLPTRFLRPWDFPGKRTGVGCHCLLHWLSRSQQPNEDSSAPGSVWQLLHSG